MDSKQDKRSVLFAGETFFSYLLTLFSIFVLVEAYLISGFKSLTSPGMFPMIAASAMVFSMVLIILENRKKAPTGYKTWPQEMRAAGAAVLPANMLIYIGIIIVYMVLLEPLTFLPSSYLFLAGSMVFLQRGAVLRMAIISACTLAAVYIIFQYLFRVILP